MRKCIQSLLLLTLLYSCSPRQMQGGDQFFYRIAVADSMHNLVDQFQLSDVATNIEIIPLELNKDYLFNKIFNIVADSSNVFLCSQGLILRYSKEGRFQNHVGRKGKGPEDYLHPFGVGIDSKAQLVYVTNTASSDKMNTYTYDGRFVKTIKVMEGAMNVIGTDVTNAYSNHNLSYDFINGRHFFRRMLPLISGSKDKWQLEVQDTAGHVLGKYYDPISSEYIDKLEPDSAKSWIYALRELSPMLNVYRNHINIMYESNDTLYRYNSATHSLEHRYLFLCGNRPNLYSIRRTTKESSYFGYIFVTDFLETKDELYVTAEQHDMAYLLRVNKLTGSVQSIKRKGEIFRSIYRDAPPPMFTNDLSGGVPFYPDYQDSLHWITAVPADQLLEMVDVDALKQEKVLFPDKRDKLVRIMENLKEDDAPVVFIVTLK